MMRNLITLLTLLLSLTLVGCGRISQQADQAADVAIDLAVNPDPPGIGSTRLSVSLTAADGLPIDGARLHIKGDMTHAGMQPVLAEIDGGRGGTYETPFEWTMGGDWIVTVSAELPDGRSTSRKFNYTVEDDICGVDPDDVALGTTEAQ